MKPSELSRLGVIVADDLAFRGYQASGIVHQLARLAAGLPNPPDVDRCPHCDGEVEQPATGRKRVYCSDRCRRAANRTKPGRKDLMDL